MTSLRITMKKIFLKRLLIFFSVLLGCYFILYYLSQGNISVPDASQYRKQLYTFVFYILPFLILGDFIYLFACLVKNALVITLLSLMVGFCGPIWLLYSINTSKDPIAGMAMILIVVMYAIASILALVILTMAQMLRDRLR